MIRRPPRSTQSRSSAASDVYKRQAAGRQGPRRPGEQIAVRAAFDVLSLIHISEPTRLGMISYAVFCWKKTTSSNRACPGGRRRAKSRQAEIAWRAPVSYTHL